MQQWFKSMFFAFSNVADGGRYFFLFYFFKRIDVFLILDNSRKILYPSEVKNFINFIYYRNEEREEIPPILKHYIFKTCASFIYEFVIATTICYCIFVFFAVSNIGKQCVLYVELVWINYQIRHKFECMKINIHVDIQQKECDVTLQEIGIGMKGCSLIRCTCGNSLRTNATKRRLVNSRREGIRFLSQITRKTWLWLNFLPSRSRSKE